jgi:hypothetical protein
MSPGTMTTSADCNDATSSSSGTAAVRFVFYRVRSKQEGENARVSLLRVSRVLIIHVRLMTISFDGEQAEDPRFR